MSTRLARWEVIVAPPMLLLYRNFQIFWGITMATFSRRNGVKDWVRLALRGGMLLTDPRFRNAVSDRVKDRFDDLADIVGERYEDASDRLTDVSDALRGRYRTRTRVLSFLAGVGVGAGVAVLLTPVSGSEIRQGIRDRASDAKDRVSETISGAKRRAGEPMAPTGT
jgi:YtxH-like protein